MLFYRIIHKMHSGIYMYIYFMCIKSCIFTVGYIIQPTNVEMTIKALPKLKCNNRQHGFPICI